MAPVSMIFPESFSPPAPPDPPAAAARRPPSIILDLDAYIADRSNATTATATSRLGHTIQVSFWAADPPAMSYLCVHCPCAAKSEDSGFEHEPRMVGAEGRFVLLRVRFADGDDEYFMYRGDPESPSLEPVPLPGTHRVPLVKEFGIVPRGDEGHYLLVARCFALGRLKPSRDELHIYSSVDQTWSVKPLPDAPGAEHTMVEKVMTLGEGVLGWVDFRKGVVVCDVLHEPFDVSFFPLPSPMPENRARLKDFHPGDPAMRVRDVTFSNGVIKFIEVEHRWIVTTIFPEKPIDPSEKNVLHDSDLLVALKNKDVDDKPKQIRKRDGWRAVTWSRAISSNCWHKGCVIDADEISVDDSIYSSLMSGLGDGHDKSLKFRNLWPSFPTLSTDVDDLVYLKSTVNANDTDGWLIALDLAKKTLKGIGSYSFARHDPCIYAFRLCSLSNHLNMASADSSQTTKLKESMDPLIIKQSNSEESSCAHVRKIGLLDQQVSPEAQEHNLNAQTNQECRDSNALSLPGSRSCLPQPPPQPDINQLNGACKSSNTHDAVNPLHAAARSIGGRLPMLRPQQNVAQWSGAGTHPNAHDANPMHATGLTSSSCPPQPPQQAVSQWNGFSYHQNHPATYNSNPLHAIRFPGSCCQPWPPQQNFSQPWNGVAGYQDHSYTPGVVNQNHWNAAGYQNQWDAANYSGGYGHYRAPAPNLAWHGTYYPGQLPAHADDAGDQPGILPAQVQAAQHQRLGAPEQWPVGSGGGNTTQTWTPRKRWREEQG